MKSSVIFIIIGIFLLFALGCGGSSGEEEMQAAFDDDDSGPNPEGDDDGADDDDVSDDDDTADDDDTGDDDDTVDDDDDDDDTVVDDDDDDEDAPTVDIITPEEGVTYDRSEIVVSVSIANADSIVVFLDSDEVSDFLTITDNSISGTLGPMDEGSHIFRVIATNEGGATNVAVPFEVDLEEPALFLNFPAGPFQVDTNVQAQLAVYNENGDNITGQVTITWTISPNTNFTRNGTTFKFEVPDDWTITASCQYGGKTLSDTEEVESVDWIPDHMTIAGPSQATAGVSFPLTVVVFNSFNEVLDEEHYNIGFSVVPSNGVTINDNIFTLTVAVLHTITATAQGVKTDAAVQDTHEVNVVAGDPYAVSLTVDRHNIDCYETVNYEAAVTDYWGNPTEGSVTMSTDPEDGVTIDEVNNQITFDRAGTFTVEASAPGFGQDSEDVNVDDSIAPEILWDDPSCPETPRGSWTNATMFTVQGRVIENESDLDVFTINGQQPTLNPNTGCFSYYSMLETGLNFFYAVAEDGFGNTGRANISVLRGNQLPNGSMVEYAIAARINQSTFDTIEDIAADLLETFDLEAMIYEYNPLVDDVFEILGSTIGITANITDINIGDPALTLQSTAGGVLLGGSVAPFYIGLSVSLTINGGAPTIYTGTVTATSVGMSGMLEIDVVNDQLVLNLDSFDAQLQGLTLDIPGMDPDYLAIISSVVVNLVEDTVEDLVIQEVPPLLEDLLSGLELTYSFSLNDATITLDALFRSSDFDFHGGTIWLDGRFQTDTVDPNTPQFSGSFSTVSTPPTMDRYTPGGDPYGFGVAVGDDFLNQALYEVYRSGLMTFHIDQEWAQQQGFSYDLTTTDLALFFPDLYILYPDTPIEFWMLPYLPPIIVYDAKDSLDLSLQLGDLTLSMMVVPEGETAIKAFTMALAIDIPVTVDLNTETNTLSLSFGIPNVYVDIYDELYDFHDELIEALVPLLIDVIMPYVGNLLGDFPIPVLEGFTVDLVDMDIFGTSDDYLGIFGDLIYDPVKDKYRLRPTAMNEL